MSQCRVSVSTESSAAHERAMRSGLTEQTSRDEADAINKRNARSALSKLPKQLHQLNLSSRTIIIKSDHGHLVLEQHLPKKHQETAQPL